MLIDFRPRGVAGVIGSKGPSLAAGVNAAAAGVAMTTALCAPPSAICWSKADGARASRRQLLPGPRHAASARAGVNRRRIRIGRRTSAPDRFSGRFGPAMGGLWRPLIQVPAVGHRPVVRRRTWAPRVGRWRECGWRACDPHAIGMDRASHFVAVSARPCLSCRSGAGIPHITFPLRLIRHNNRNTIQDGYARWRRGAIAFDPKPAATRSSKQPDY